MNKFKTNKTERNPNIIKTKSITMKKERKRHIIECWCATLVATALALSSSILEAADAPPPMINYQGYLVDSNGDPLGSKLDGDARVSSPANYIVRFKIYDKQSGEAEYGDPWEEDQVVTVDNGYFNVYLGEVTEIPFTVFNGTTADERFVGITVDLDADGKFENNSEISPRLRLLSAPYAFFAQRAVEADRITSGGVNVFTVDGPNANLKKTMVITPAEGENALELHPGSGEDYTGTINLTESGNLTLGVKDATVLTLGKNGDVKMLGTLWTSQSTLPHITLDSNGGGGGDDWEVQGSYVKIGESDNASMFMTYVGNGWGYTGAGGDINELRGRPSGGYWAYDYNKEHVHSPSMVGIGTSTHSSTYKLDVKGNIRLGDDTLDTQKLKLQSKDGDWTVGSGNQDVFSKNNFYVWDDNQSDGQGYVFNIESETGFVGIGKAKPNAGLHIDTGKVWTLSQGKLDFERMMQMSGNGGAYSFIIADHQGDWEMVSDYLAIGKVGSSGHDTVLVKLDNAGDGWKVPSDRTLKKDIESYSKRFLEGVTNIDLYKYRLKQQSADSAKQVGVIAQDVQKYFPEFFPNTVGTLSLNYGKVAILAFPAIKELKQEKDADVVSLRAENKILRDGLSSLKSEVELLKARLANVDTKEDRLAKLEQLVGALGQGE
jgi:hypothetical protein